MKYQFNAQVREGKLHIINRKAFDEAIREIGGDLILSVEKKKSKRSLDQNAYYFGAVLPIIQQGFKELGYKLNKEEVHEFLKNKFLSIPVADKDNVFVGSYTRSTASLNKMEFADYIEDIAQFAAQILGFEIPPPLTQTTINYTNLTYNSP